MIVPLFACFPAPQHKVLAYILDNLKQQGDRLSKLESNVSALSDTSIVHGDSLAALKALLLTFKPGGSDADLDELREKMAVISGRLDNQTKEIVVLANSSKEHARNIDSLEQCTSGAETLTVTCSKCLHARTLPFHSSTCRASHARRLLSLRVRALCCAGLQSLMPTKADVSDLALKASKVSVDRHERELEDLSGIVKGDHEARLKILEAGLKRLSQAVDALSNDDFKAEAIRRISELEDQAKLTVDTLNEHTRQLGELGAALNTKAEQVYVDTELENLLNRLKELELALAHSMKGELKRFERDVMIYVADQLTNSQAHGNGAAGGGGGGGGGGVGGGGSGHSHMHSNTAAGKMHFRCLTCDQPRDNVPGAQTSRYAYGKSMGSQISASGVANSDSRLLEMQLGDQVYLHGTDGAVYRGRTDPPQMQLTGASAVPQLTGTDALLRLQSPSAQPSHRGNSPDRYLSSARKSRPQSADPSRAHAHRQQIDPNSGRKSGVDLQLPLQHMAELAEGKEQPFDSGSGTARTLHFPSPGKVLTARASTGMASGATTARQSATGLPRSNSSADVGLGGGGGGGGGAHSAGGSTPTGASPLSPVRKARPSTAQARSSLSSDGGRVLVGSVASPSAASMRSKNGVEIVTAFGED